MLATGELQPLTTELDFLELAELLRRKVAGEPLPSFIHEVNAYSAAPEDLVRGRCPAPGTDAKGMAWYFYGAANCHESAGGAPRRNRQVGGGRERRFWHPEGGKKPIVDRDSKPVGAYWRTLSYVSKTKNPSGAKKSFRNTRLGWCMIEIGLDHHHQLVLCKVYRSPRGTADPTESCTAAAGAEDVGPAAGTGLSGVEDGLHDSALEGGAIPDVTGGGMPCPPEPPPASYDNNLHPRGVARKPALLLIGPASKHGTLAIVNKSNAASVAATIVMKFDGSSIPSAERMKEMAKLVIVSQNPVVVLLSAMGNTNTNIRLAAWKALRCGARKANEIYELAIIKELHLRTIDELGLDRSIVSGSLDELEQHLQYVAMTKELTPSTQDYLISFGERASTKMFSDYLNKLGKEEWELCSITNFGRSGGDLTTTTIGRALGLREIQVWRDVDSMFTCDPKVCGNAIHVPYLTFDEAAELRYISEQSMQIAMEVGIKVIVKNSYNPQAGATVITKTRDMSKSILTSIALKSNITILDIERTSTLDQNAFVEKAISIFQNFEYLSISVDWIATSEGKMSFTLVPSKLLTQELIQPALDMSVHELQNIADVHRLHDMSVISLIGNPGRSIDILGKALSILQSSDVAIEKVSQGVSKVTKISLVVHDTVAKHCVQALHSAFFELNDDTPALVKSSGSGNKRKADAGHPEAPLGMHREKMVTECMVLENLERTLLSDNNGDRTEFFDSVSSDNMGVYYDEDQACALAASGLEVDDYFRFEDMLLGGLPPNVFPSPYNPETLHEFSGGDFGGFPCKYSWSSLFFKCSSLFFKCSGLWASLSIWWLQVKARYRFHHQTC